MMNVIEMTQEGIQKLRDELENRTIFVRAEVAERIKVALSFGDLSENSEYDDAKQAQGENELRIHEIEKILKTAKVISEDSISKTEVKLGTHVTIKDLATNEKTVYLIVSSKEEDIFENKISSESPVGSALIGKRRNDKVKVKTPGGNLEYQIVKIGK